MTEGRMPHPYLPLRRTPTDASTATSSGAMGAGVVARLHAEPAFRVDLETAQSELADVRARNVTIGSDCTAEAAGLAQ